MKFYKQSLLCVIAMATTAGTASAQWGGGMGGYNGYGAYNSYAITSYVHAPPYFALHPPVYYGKRYTRPYGVSPFAAPPQLQTNASYVPAPHAERSISISNPYCAIPQNVLEIVPAVVPSSDGNLTPEQHQTPPSSPVVQNQSIQPLVIDNPYFQAPQAVATRDSN